MDDPLEIVRDWSSLPADILPLFLRGLNDTATDCRRLRSVCTSWRSSISPKKSNLQFPLKIILPFPTLLTLFFDNAPNEIGFLRQSIFYLICSPGENSSNNWLIRVEEESGRPNICTLRSPIYPALESRQAFKRAQVNFLDYRIYEVATSYILRGHRSEAKKTVLIPRSGATDRYFSILARWNDGSLGLFKAGAEKWVIAKGCHGFSDIIAYEGMFYATSVDGKLISINPNTFEVKEIIKSHSKEEEYSTLFTYLVESYGRLYLVNKRTGEQTHKPLEIKVFIMGDLCLPNGENNHYWEPVTSLGDRVFFVSEYVTFSLLGKEIGWGEGNCIFFTQERYKGRHGFYDFQCYDAVFDIFTKFCGIYNLEDGKIVTYNGILPSKYTKTFWPVPSWLASN